MVVLPVPGGPHRIIEASLPAATIRPIAPSGPVRCSCPITSSSRAGAAGRRAAHPRAAAAAPRLRQGRLNRSATRAN